jgi:predicted nuclease of predicted toxin-antitoxin system
MRLLIDANLSPVVVSGLSAKGFDVSHVSEHGLLTASDQEISDHAIESGSAIVSADSDFATMLALSKGKAPSLILLRSVDQLAPQEQVELLANNLGEAADEIEAGAVVSIRPGHLRVRLLPLG